MVNWHPLGPIWHPFEGAGRWFFQTFLEFSPRTLGKWSIFDEHIFQRDWFNHHLDMVKKNTQQPALRQLLIVGFPAVNRPPWNPGSRAIGMEPKYLADTSDTVLRGPELLPSPKLTYPLKIGPPNRTFIFQPLVFSPYDWICRTTTGF